MMRAYCAWFVVTLFYIYGGCIFNLYFLEDSCILTFLKLISISAMHYNPVLGLADILLVLLLKMFFSKHKTINSILLALSVSWRFFIDTMSSLYL